MRIFPIGCEVIFTRPDDPWKGQIGTIKSEPSENGRYLVEVGNTTKLRHGDDMCEASQYMKEKAMQNTQVTDLSNLDINNLVKFTQSLIEFDNTDLIAQANQVVAKYKDLVITENDLAEMKTVRADLNKIVKGLDDQRKNIKKEYNAPLTEFENKIKEVTTVISNTIANIDNQTILFEENRKKNKHTEVMAIMADMLNSVDLPPEYLAKVVFREEYYNKTMVNKKLKDSIQEQIDTQINLYNGWKAEQELRQQYIKNREMQIAMLNKQYNANGTYSMFTIETHTDEQVVAKYEANHQRKLEQARLEKERQDAEETKKQAIAETQNVQRQSTDVGKPLESQSSMVEENQSVLQSESQSKNIMAEESKKISTLSETSVAKTFTITLDAGDAATSTEAMATVEKRLAEMSHNFATKYGIKMELCQA